MEIALILLKFAALIVGGVFAAIGLLTNYRNEDETVSKWGKRALLGIVLSTIIGAATQGVESYRNRQTALANDAANRKSEEQTRNVLGQIKRAIYPLRNIALQQLLIVYPADNSLISTALDRITVPSLSRNEGLGFSIHPWDNLRRGTPNYPKEGILLELIEPYIRVSLWKKSVDALRNDPDLKFAMRLDKTDASILGDSLTVSADFLPVPDNCLILSQGMASLEDIRDAEIRVEIVVAPVSEAELLPVLNEVSQNTKILVFRLSIANHDILAELHRVDRFLFEGKISASQ